MKYWIHRNTKGELVRVYAGALGDYVNGLPVSERTKRKLYASSHADFGMLWLEDDNGFAIPVGKFEQISQAEYETILTFSEEVDTLQIS